MNIKNFFYRLPQNVVKIFSGRNLLWQLLAVGLTYVVVVADIDWRYFLATRSIPQAAWIPAAAVGGLLPMVLPFILWGAGYAAKNFKISFAGFALGQAAFLGWFISSFYKAFTGRIPPVVFGVAGNLDTSHGFQFGFWRGGIFWGWPSSHTTVAFAMAMALLSLFPNNKVIRACSLLYALYIGLAVSVSIHWLSEALAGAVFGTIIGLAVGKSFLERLRASGIQ